MQQIGKTALILLSALLCATYANAIDLLPGELTAPSPGIKQVLISYQLSDRGDRFKDGLKMPGSRGLTSEQFQLRAGFSFEADKYPAFFYAQLPLGSIESSGLLKNQAGHSGAGDVSFLLALWPYADRENQEYFAVGAYLTLPTGTYQPEKIFNMGSNRMASALQFGYQRQLTSRLQGMMAVDGVWFGQNDDYSAGHFTLNQRNLYTGQTGLKYFINDKYSLSAAYFYTIGGENIINGVARQDDISLRRYQLTGAANLSFGRIILQYGGDIDTRNGLIETKRVILRYGTAF